MALLLQCIKYYVNKTKHGNKNGIINKITLLSWYSLTLFVSATKMSIFCGLGKSDIIKVFGHIHPSNQALCLRNEILILIAEIRSKTTISLNSYVKHSLRQRSIF